MKRLRIALTADPEIPVPPVHYGGIERIVDMLARGLVDRGHDVTLFSNSESTCPVERIAWPGRSSSSHFDTLKNSAKLVLQALNGRFDVVHSFSRLAYLLPILPLHIPKLMSYQRGISQNTTASALRLSRGSLEFSAISRQMIDAHPLQGTWHLVSNGVPLGIYEYRSKVSDNAPLVFLGRLEEIKGPHLAIEIARRTGRRLIIAGNIPDNHHGWFDANVAPHIDGSVITYVGPVNDTEKDKILGAAAALLMPILWEEPFGIVMIEAMACGTPVLGLLRGAVPEVVQDGVTGFVTDTVDELVASVGRLDQLSRRDCRTRVERLYSSNAVTDGYLSIYTAMIDRLASAGTRARHRTTG